MYISPRQGSLDKQRLSSELDKLFISQHIRHPGRQTELKKINNNIRQKQHEFEAITRDLEEVKEYLTEGQQNRLAEIDREWDGFELE